LINSRLIYIPKVKQDTQEELHVSHVAAGKAFGIQPVEVGSSMDKCLDQVLLN
jgi:hypothetical protein